MLSRYWKPALGLTVSSLLPRISHCQETSKETQETSESHKKDYIAIFLSKASQKDVLSHIPPLFSKISADHVTLFYNPKEETKENMSDILGHSARITLHAIATDTLSQVGLVTVSNDDHEPIECENTPHLTISYTQDAKDSNTLLNRLHQTGAIQSKQEEEGTTLTLSDYEGILPERHSKNPDELKTTTASLIALEKPLVLEGIVCTKEAFNGTDRTCAIQPKPECGFCKFMKAGPCKVVFRKWESCLDASKKNGTDFLEQCGEPTLALRDCVDAHPEYYSVLNDEETSAEKPVEGSGNEESSLKGSVNEKNSSEEGANENNSSEEVANKNAVENTALVVDKST